MGRNGGPASDRSTPQAVEHMLGQLEARAAKASDETLTSAVSYGPQGPGGVAGPGRSAEGPGG